MTQGPPPAIDKLPPGLESKIPGQARAMFIQLVNESPAPAAERCRVKGGIPVGFFSILERQFEEHQGCTFSHNRTIHAIKCETHDRIIIGPGVETEE